MNLYYFSLIVLVIGLPLSPFATSASQMWLGINWILEGQFKKKWAIIKSDRILWLYLLLPLTLLVGLWNTTDFAWAAYDLKIKLPLLAIPLIMRTSARLNAKQINTILWYFTWALFSGTIISMAVYAGFLGRDVTNIRNISIFISHIRFSLMIVFSISYLIWYLWKNYTILSFKKKLMTIALIIWFLIFITILRSMTSWIILLLLFYILLILYYNRIPNKKLQKISILLAVTLPLLVFTFVWKVYEDYATINPIDFSELPTHTPRGNKYRNDTTKTAHENGNYVYILISTKEIRANWHLFSDVPILEKNDNGYSTEHRVVRYLTSLGLPKDLDGLKQLDAKDIQLIEDGYATCIHRKKFKPYIKVYETIFDIDVYKNTGNPNDKSVSMRYEYFKTGLHIIKHNFWFGVGTGDSSKDYQEAYVEMGSKLKQHNRHRAHNQFLLFFVSFGLIGFIACSISVFGPFYVTKNRSFLLISICIILFLSMLNEDTIETQAGVTFYILFYCLLVTHNKVLTND